MRPAIPYDPPRKNSEADAKGADLRWTRTLAEAGKLTSPGKRIPFYRMKPEPPEDVA